MTATPAVGTVISTVHEYEALPVGAVVRGIRFGVVAERIDEEEFDYRWAFMSNERGAYQAETVARDLGEALVLWLPEPEPQAPAAPARIDRFEGEYFFLSNFYVHQTLPDGRKITGEHLFQAMKAMDDAAASRILNAPTPAKAKYYGRSIQLRPDWEQVKVEMMRNTLRQKFLDRTPESRELADKLLATGNALLIEGNTWGDRFWGVDAATGAGENKLGQLLMELREHIRRVRAHG